MRSRNNKMFLFFFILFSLESTAQSPSWPISTTVANYNQINCTFTEKHSAFHGALDLHIANNEKFLAILPGIVEEDASTLLFMRTRHDFLSNTDVNSNLKKVRYGDDTDPLSGITGISTSPLNYSTITLGQEIGKIVSQNHLHFEMWVRDCPNGCDWYLVDPLNNSYPNYQNQPPGYNDIYDVELNDVILEPQDANSGIIFNPGNGLTEWYYNSCKIHKKDRPDSQGVMHAYSSTNITVFGNILPTIHVRDTEVTNGINSTGEGLGIYECTYYIENELKYWLKFDKIEEIYKQEWDAFFNHKYNIATGNSVLYGNHDYIKMHRMTIDQYCAPHKSTDSGIWKTRSLQGDVNQIANISQNAEYVDGYYDVDFYVFDAAENMDEASNRITVDNFLPYIKKVTLSNSNGLIYEGEWNLNALEDALEFQKCTYQNGITNGFSIEVETSESLENLDISIGNVNNFGLTSLNSDKTLWGASITFSVSTTEQTITFNGLDTAGNSLLTDPSNLYWRVGDDTWKNGTTNESVEGNLITLGITVDDTLHKLNLPVNDNCASGNSCTDNYEPNNTQSQATQLYSFGHDYSWNNSLTDECLDQATADIDWYRMNLTHQGVLTINLSSQQISSLYMDWLDNGNVTSSTTVNGGKQIVICSNNGPACYDTALRIYTTTQNGNDPIPYTLDIQWSAGQNCNSGKTSKKSNKDLNKESSTIAINGDTDVCEGLSNSLSISDSSESFDWFVNGESVHIGNTFNTQSLNIGEYDLFVIATNDVCSFAETQLNISSGVTANAGQDKTITNGESITLQGLGGSTYSWSPSTGLSNPNIWNPVATPNETTTYTLTVTGNGCTDTDMVTIIVDDGTGGDTPPNDNCNDAISLNSNTSCNDTSGTINHATDDGFPTKPTCDIEANPNAFGVFYSFIAQSNTHTIKVNPTGQLDAVITIYSGSNCYNLSEFDCEDTIGGNGLTTTLTNNSFTIGEEYWIRVYDYGKAEPSIGEGGFEICITHDDSSGQDGMDLISNITNISNNNPDVGDSINVTFTITNNGNEDINETFAVGLYLSTNQNFGSADDVFPTSTAGIVSLDAGETKTFTKTITIPNENDGQYYIISNPDIGNNISEYNEENNYDYSIIQIGEIVEDGPNLDIKDLNIVPDTNLAPGQEINVEIEVKNEGNEDSDSFITAIIFDVGDDGRYDPSEDTIIGTKSFSGIDAGERKTKDDEFYLPTNIPATGTYQIIAIADFDNEIVETDEDDNDKDEEIYISTLTPAGPDLIGNFIKWEIDETTTQVNPMDLCLETEYRLYWEIINIGNADVSGGFSIYHRAVISKDEFYDGTDIFFDSRSKHAASHDVGDVLSIDDNNNWEGIAPGDYYLLIIADEDREIDEIDEQNNVMAFPIRLSNCNNTQYPDLKIEINSVNPYSSKLGDYLTVEMTISNIGEVPVSDFEVELYLSDDQTFQGDGGSDTVNDHRLADDGNETIQTVLNPGESIQHTMRAYTRNDNGLQAEINNTGIYYLFASLDEEGDFIELDRENNIAYVPIELTSVDCYYNFSDEVKTITYNDNYEYILDISTKDECTYTINAIEDWITYPKNRLATGNAGVVANFEENPYPFPRTGHIDVDGKIFEFTQEARPCEMLDESLKLTISDFGIEEINCSQNGAIYIFPEKGFPPYNFEWSNGQTIEDITNLTADGDYTVTVTDAAGCSIEKTFTLTSNIDIDTTLLENDNIISSNQSGAQYQWVDCGNGNAIIEGETNQSFSPTRNGSYAVEITTNSCTEISECLNMTTLSVQSEELKNNTKIYPNPVDEMLYIDLAKRYESISLKMYNFLGQQVYNSKHKNLQNLNIQTNNIASGVYLLKVQVDGKYESEFRIVKE